MALVLRDLFIAYEKRSLTLHRLTSYLFIVFDRDAATRDADPVAADRWRDLTTPCTISFPPPRFS